MPKLVMMITSRVDRSHEIGEAWQAVGAPGVTLLGSHGLRTLQEKNLGEVLAGVISMSQIIRTQEESTLIMLSVVEDETLVEKIVAATEAIVGDLNEPNNGLIFTLDVERTFGLRYHGTR